MSISFENITLRCVTVDVDGVFVAEVFAAAIAVVDVPVIVVGVVDLFVVSVAVDGNVVAVIGNFVDVVCLNGFLAGKCETVL